MAEYESETAMDRGALSGAYAADDVPPYGNKRTSTNGPSVWAKHDRMHSFFFPKWHIILFSFSHNRLHFSFFRP